MKPDYQPGELILKFRDEAIIGAVAGELLQNRRAFQEITGDPHIDRLNARYKARAIRRVFGKEAMPGTATGPIDRQTAQARHRQQRDRFKAEVSSIREKRLKKKGLKSLPAEKDLPYLGSVYKVEVDPATDIEQACREYGKDPQVAYCQPNYRMEAQWIPNDPYYLSSNSWGQSYDDLWGLKKLHTAEAWDVTKGEGVVVAVVDTGADYNHIDLAANIWTNSGEIPGNGIDDDNNGFIDDVRGWDFVNNDNDPLDGHGHGTHVSGTIAAVGNNELGIIGVAPSARIMPLKGLSDTGSGEIDGLAAAIRYAADNGADVINNSWGCSSACPSNPVAEDAVKYAHDLGAVVVFAAGNSQNDVTLYSPGNQANSVITVASSTELDTRSYFSNIGSLIDVAAPGGGEDGGSPNRVGRNILSLRAGTTDMYADGLCTVGTNYYRSRGTSMAAPHVAGVAALVVAAHPAFTPDDVSQALRGSADDIESAGFDLLSGAGRVNAQKAVTVGSVPRVRITGPLAPINVRNTSSITINGDAYGGNYAKHRLFYATLDKSFANNQYAPTMGAWQALGGESFQSVTDGVLGTFNSSMFQPARTYLLKLEVTTTDNLRFTDVKEIQFYEDDPRFHKLATVTPYAMFPLSVGDRFAWIDREPSPVDGTIRYFGKVYDGATDKMVTLSVEGGDVTNIGLTSDRVVWGEGNQSLGVRTVIGSFTPSGEIAVEWANEFGSGLSFSSVDQDTVLLSQQGFDYTARIPTTTGYLLDARTKTTSPGILLPDGNHVEKLSLRAGSVLSFIYYPNTGRNDEIFLTDTTTGMTQLIKGVKDLTVDRVANGSRALVWVEKNWPDNDFPLIMFDKVTGQISTVAGYSHASSFATEGNTILYSAWGNESGYSINNLYAYDIGTGATSLFATNYERLDETFPAIGTRHIQWLRGNNIIVRNEIPVLAGVGNQVIELSKPLSLPIAAFDPEVDKIDLSAVGGTWPDAPAALPAGATFTDNGDGTGSLQWTPTTAGVYTVSFMARDFTGRKHGTWNAVQTATYLAYDPNDPLQSLAVSISGSGTVHSSPAPDINCATGTCSQGYSNGTVVTLTATPTNGHQLSSWSGACSGACSGAGVCTVTMDQARMVTATFTIIPVSTLSVTIAGSGTVHSTPAPDINCATGTCSQSYSNGTVVTLTATPTSGYQLSGWSGACSGVGVCTATMDQARLVTATFTNITGYPLTVSISGSGTVHSSPAPDINCATGTCSQSYSNGTVVTLTATPTSGYQLSGWGGACSGAGACTVTMDQARLVTATFTNITGYPLTVSISGSGTVHSTPAPDINCATGTCSQSYINGTVVTLTATPTSGYQFSSWSGACSGAGVCSVTMDQARLVTATFTSSDNSPRTLTVSLNIMGNGRGTVRTIPLPGIDCNLDGGYSHSCTQSYINGTTVTLAALPAAGSFIRAIMGDCVPAGGSCSITMNQDRDVQVFFMTTTCVAKISDCHTSLRDAYLQATNGSNIKAAGMTMDSLNADRDVSVTLEGGYDAATYEARPGVTMLPQLTITSGTVTVSDIVIQ